MATEGFSKGYVFTMAAATGSATVNVLEGFERCYLQVATMASATSMDVYASTDGGTTYYQVRHYPNPLTATVLAPSFIISGGLMTNGGLVPMPPGFQYYKLQCTDSNPVGVRTFTLLVNT